jgi:hypothetical protein
MITGRSPRRRFNSGSAQRQDASLRSGRKPRRRRPLQPIAGPEGGLIGLNLTVHLQAARDKVLERLLLEGRGLASRPSPHSKSTLSWRSRGLQGPLGRLRKSAEIRCLVFHVLTRTRIAVCASASLLFAVLVSIRIPLSYLGFQRLQALSPFCNQVIRFQKFLMENRVFIARRAITALERGSLGRVFPKTSVHPVLITTDVWLDSATPRFRRLCPFCVQQYSTRFDLPNFSNVLEEPFVRASQ